MSPGKLTIEFTRRLSKPDGSFAGVVVSSLDIAELEKFFSSLDLGNRESFPWSAPTACFVRAAVPTRRPQVSPGCQSRNSPLFRGLREELRLGTYWNKPRPRAAVRRHKPADVLPDGLGRSAGRHRRSGRTRHFPASRRDIAKIHSGRNGVLTLIVLIVMVFGAAHQAHILAAAGRVAAIPSDRSKQPIV